MTKNVAKKNSPKSKRQKNCQTIDCKNLPKQIDKNSPKRKLPENCLKKFAKRK